MARVRINFIISDEMYYWILSQPNIDSVERDGKEVIVTHHMTGPQITAIRTGFMDKLIEAIP